MAVQWHSPSYYTSLPAHLQDWLLNTGSLTERLQALTSFFAVDLLGQELMEIDRSEARLLQQNTKAHEQPRVLAEQKWQVREVILKGDEAQKATIAQQQNMPQKDWIFARSVLPNELCNSKWANLGNQPLGKRIFNDDNFVRSDFEIGILQYHPITKAAFAPYVQCWARRSKFQIEEFELIVAEAFLPDAPCYW